MENPCRDPIIPLHMNQNTVHDVEKEKDFKIESDERNFYLRVLAVVQLP